MFTNEPKPDGLVSVDLTQRDCELLSTACFEAHAVMEKRKFEDPVTLIQLHLLGNVFNALWYAMRPSLIAETNGSKE